MQQQKFFLTVVFICVKSKVKRCALKVKQQFFYVEKNFVENSLLLKRRVWGAIMKKCYKNM